MLQTSRLEQIALASYVLGASLALALVVPLLGGSSNVSADEPLEVIWDLNIAHLHTTPKLPWTRDPFLKKPGFVKFTPKVVPFKLEAILEGDEESIAIINGTPLKAREHIHGKRIVEIGSNFVVLEEADSLLERTLPPLERPRTRLEIEEVNE